MSYDKLLRYLSEKGAGSWPDLKEAWEWLTGPSDDPSGKAWIAARDLAALGHIEIAWEGRVAWSAAPPLLTMLPRSGGRALFTGARTRFMYSPRPGDCGDGELMRVADKLGLWVDECGAVNGPVSVLVACRTADEVQALADALGIDYTYEVAAQLAALLPPLSSYARLWPPGELPRGFEPERFNPGSLRWQETDDLSHFGLYRCRTYAGHAHALKAVTGWRRVTRELATYEVLRWDDLGVLRYRRPSYQLSVPAGAPLPVLHARAATLCSGRLPTFRRHPEPRLHYENVPEMTAERIASALNQVLEVVDE